jgi:hypothetical protein
MLTTKEFNGPEHHVFCQQQYDEARRYLKNCGKPKDEIDRFLIEKHKVDAHVFGRALDRTNAVKMLQKKAGLSMEAKFLIAAMDAYLGKS